MAALPQDRRGQTLLALTVVAVSVGYFVWAGTPIGGVPGLKQLAKTRDSLQIRIDSIDAQVRRAKEDVRRGTESQLEARLAEFQTSLDLMRQLVPASGEVPNLVDDISSRAKMRGATVANFVPQALESGSPFDTQRYRFTVTGQYDQVGEFLSDIASLPRIIVPYEVHLERVSGPAADTTQQRPVLQAGFLIRTYVKPSGPAAPAAAPAAAPQAGARGGDGA